MNEDLHRPALAPTPAREWIAAMRPRLCQWASSGILLPLADSVLHPSQWRRALGGLALLTLPGTAQSPPTRGAALGCAAIFRLTLPWFFSHAGAVFTVKLPVA